MSDRGYAMLEEAMDGKAGLTLRLMKCVALRA
jgi:hypothetical protein